MFIYRQKMTSAACSFTLKESGSSCGLPCQYGLLLSSVLLLPCSYADLPDPTASAYASASVEKASIPVKALSVASLEQKHRAKTITIVPTYSTLIKKMALK